MMNDMLTDAEIRGLARFAARQVIPAGRAYREMCRAYRVPSNSWSAFAYAYDDELHIA